MHLESNGSLEQYKSGFDGGVWLSVRLSSTQGAPSSSSPPPPVFYFVMLGDFEL